MSRRKGWAGANEPDETQTDDHRAIRPTATSRRTGRRTRRPSGRAAKVPPATHRPCTHCALSVHHRHAPAVHRPCTHLSRLTVLRPPTPATPCHQPPTRTHGVHVPPRPATAQFVTLASLDARRPPPDAGARRLPRAREQSHVPSRVMPRCRRAHRLSTCGPQSTTLTPSRLRLTHSEPHTPLRVKERDPREDGEERYYLWLGLNC